MSKIMCASDCIRFKMRDTGDLIRKHQKTIDESTDEREVNAAKYLKHEHLKEMDKYIKRLKSAIKQEKKDRAFFASL
tara:strand:- start:426 stop:656 length:231 start_codon:yes stop_codon:yes gene_type:complete